jgi:hypothetical protein
MVQHVPPVLCQRPEVANSSVRRHINSVWIHICIRCLKLATEAMIPPVTATKGTIRGVLRDRLKNYYGATKIVFNHGACC